MLIGRFVSQGQRKRRKSITPQGCAIITDWTAVFTALSAALAIALPLLEYVLRKTFVLPLISILSGLAVIFIGYGIAYFANREIRENWSATIDKTQEQELVTSGIYARIRHPLYLSGILILVGSNIYFTSSWAWVSVLLISIVISIRIPLEEKRLVDRFGKEYNAYQMRSKRILPWIL